MEKYISKKIAIYYIVFCLLILGLFFLAIQTSHASSLPDQTDSSANTAYPAAVGSGEGFMYQTLGNGLTGNISEFTVKYFNPGSPISSGTLKLCYQNSTSTNAVNCDDSYGNNAQCAANFIGNIPTGTSTIIFYKSTSNSTSSCAGNDGNSVYTFNPAYEYNLLRVDPVGIVGQRILGSANSASYPAGECQQLDNSTCTIGYMSTGTAVDWYWTSDSNSFPSIVITHPTASSTQADFNTWELQLEAAETGNIVKIFYSLPGTNIAYTDQGQIFDSGSITLDVGKTHPLFFPPLSTTTMWQAQGVLYDANLQPRAVSPVINFYINAEATSTLFPVPIIPITSTSTINSTSSLEICNGQWTDTYFGIPFFASSSPSRAFCEVKNLAVGIIQYIFVPSDQSVSKIGDTINSFKTVFPFAPYFYIVNGVENTLVSANTTTTQTLDLKVKDLQFNDRTLLTLNSSTLKNALTTGNCNSSCASSSVENVFTWVKVVIWMTAGLKIVAMIAHF